MPRHPARVHIILARKADTAIVIRRGPSKAVCTIGWNLRTDAFQVGQWLKARIYERRCDLSPDGRHLIYFALDGRWKGPMRGSWTAISRAPYLKAIGLWANGSGWNGGGLFISDTAYWLNKFFHHTMHLTPKRMKERPEHPFHESYGGECPGVYYIRLQRDGWKLVRHASGNKDTFVVFEKSLWCGWRLEKTAHATIDHPVGKGCYFDTHRLVHDDGQRIIDLPAWEWADIHKRRVLFVVDGVLSEARLTDAGLVHARQIQDFNGMSFEALKAPY